MSLLTRLFRKKNEEDYETVLSSLALDIQNRQVKLSEIRLRERRSTLLVTLYTLAGWVAYVSLWYLSMLPNFSGRTRGSKLERAVKALPIVIGPILILFVRRIVQIWYTRKGDAEEKMLRVLLRQQRSKVEEIKKKTNYYSTVELIQRYDESPSSPSLGLRLRNASASTQPSTPQRQPVSPSTNLAPSPNIPNPRPAQSPLGPPRKLWFDKLADALLGDEDQVPNAAASRYALICEKCFAHNGLVKESMWEDAQYLCPKCNHFNSSARSKKQARGSSPSSLQVNPASASATRNLTPERHPPVPNESQPSADTDVQAVAQALHPDMVHIHES